MKIEHSGFFSRITTTPPQQEMRENGAEKSDMETRH